MAEKWFIASIKVSRDDCLSIDPVGRCQRCNPPVFLSPNDSLAKASQPLVGNMRVLKMKATIRRIYKFRLFSFLYKIKFINL